MSENLFRFSIIRPPIAPDARYPPIELSQDSDFQVALARAAANNPLDPRKALDDVAASFIQSPEFAQPAASDQNNIRLEVAYSALDDIDKTTLDHDKTFIELNSKLGVSIDGFLQEPWLAPLVRRIKDTIVALRQLGIEETVGHLATLTRRLRTIETIKKVDMDPSFPFDASDLQLWRDRPVLAPTLVDLKSILSNAEARAEQDRIRKARYEATQGLINQRWNDHLRLASAIKAIKSIPIRNRVIAPPQPWTPPAPPPHLTREGLVNRHLQFVNTFGDLAIKQYERGLALLEPSRINVARAKAGTASAAADDGSSNNSEARINFEKFSDTSIKAVAGITPLVDMSRLMIQNLREIAPDVEIGSFKPNKVTSFTMKQEGLAVLPQDVQALLKEQGLDLSEQPIDSVVSTLENQLTGTSAALDELYKPYNTTLAKITRVGGLTIRSQRKNRMVDWAGALARGSTKAPSITAESVANIFDHLRPRGKLTVLGVADLLVVEQQLIGYEGGDVGYVENVLKGETKSREQTVSSKTEVELFEESETTTTRETENTTTERFEMSIETNNVIKDKESTKAGITISASYGPFVSMSANASKASDRSKEEASKVANDYTKEITSKASDRLQQRVLRRQTTKTTIENIVKESHILKNDAGSQHIAGVYQFYSKVYEAQTWNYGKRTILDFMLPEPGAFLFDKLSSPEAKGGDTTDFVEEFSMEISEILPTNYASIGATYGVTGLDPPPVSMQRMGASFAAGKKEEPMSKADKFTIPAGYKCTSISAAATGVPVAAPYVWTAGDTTYKYTGPSTGYIAIIAGAFSWVWNPKEHGITGHSSDFCMENIEGQLDWSVSAANMTNFSCTLELFLEVTPAAELAWKTKCWMAIKAAADKIKQAQDATQRQAKFQSTMVASPVQGRNPDINLIIMRNEIKKMCISTMTDQHFDNFSAIDRVSLQAESAPDDSGTKPPTMQISQINVDKAWKHGPFVRFFEQAFEWDQMTWLTYPYFWGRKSEWLTKIEYQDEDPQFEKFMQAGYARANVPVRPGFEGALEHYLATGRIWEGGPLPGMTSPTFLPLAMEIQESLGKKAQEPTKYGDPWIVKVPTNLVRLRKDDKMPEWSKESGEWKLKPDS